MFVLSPTATTESEVSYLRKLQ